MSEPSISLADWPWNPALLPWQRNIILAIERGDHFLSTGYHGGKRLMAVELRKRWEARHGKPEIKGFRADVIFIDEIGIPLDKLPTPVPL